MYCWHHIYSVTYPKFCNEEKFTFGSFTFTQSRESFEKRNIIKARNQGLGAAYLSVAAVIGSLTIVIVALFITRVTLLVQAEQNDYD